MGPAIDRAATSQFYRFISVWQLVVFNPVPCTGIRRVVAVCTGSVEARNADSFSGMLFLVVALAFACRVHADAHVGQDRNGNLIVNSSGLPGVGVYIDGEERDHPVLCRTRLAVIIIIYFGVPLMGR